VVVAIIQLRKLKIEEEKGSRPTLFGPGLFDPNVEIKFVNVIQRSGAVRVCRVGDERFRPVAQLIRLLRHLKLVIHPEVICWSKIEKNSVLVANNDGRSRIASVYGAAEVVQSLVGVLRAEGRQRAVRGHVQL